MLDYFQPLLKNESSSFKQNDCQAAINCLIHLQKRSEILIYLRQLQTVWVVGQTNKLQLLDSIVAEAWVTVKEEDVLFKVCFTHPPFQVGPPPPLHTQWWDAFEIYGLKLKQGKSQSGAADPRQFVGSALPRTRAARRQLFVFLNSF